MTPIATDRAPVRVAAFVSHYHGAAVLEALLESVGVRVVLVATDDPELPWCNAANRVWRYDPVGPREAVPAVARAAGLDPFTGRVNGTEFMARVHEVRPHALVACVFGQLIIKPLEYVAKRAYNFHPTVPGAGLAATRGATGLELARARGGRTCVTLHRMTEQFDTGEELAHSPPLTLPASDEALPAFMRETAPLLRAFAATVLPAAFRADGLLDGSTGAASGA